MTDITRTKAQVAVVFPDEAEIYDGIAAATIEAGQPLYLVAATGKWGLADANGSGKQQFRGIALNDAGAGQAVSVLKCGTLAGFTLTGDYDSAVYLSDTVGELADAAGTMEVIVGRVVPLSDASLTKVLFVCADWLRAWT